MYFCANPKCLFHVDVARRILMHTMKLREPVRSLSEELPTHVMVETREKHLWKNPEKATEWFFCDVCHEAALMVVLE